MIGSPMAALQHLLPTVKFFGEGRPSYTIHSTVVLARPMAVRITTGIQYLWYTCSDYMLSTFKNVYGVVYLNLPWMRMLKTHTQT